MKLVLWRILGAPLFRASFHNWYPLRRMLLRLFGTRLACTTRFRNSVRIDRPWNLAAGHFTIVGDRAVLRCRAPVTIGDRCVISQLAIVTTVARQPDVRDHPKRIAPIAIEDDCWIAADALVLPGVTVHAGTVVGARALVDGDLPGWRIAVGEPAAPRGVRAFHGRPSQGARA